MEIPGYKVLKPIGAGGMATAYLAVQASLGRQIVLKVLDTTQGVSPENVERFINEGRILASLNHPNVITIHDIGRYDNLVYLAMEYIEGGDLKSRMSRVLSPQEALDIVKKIAGALDCAHKAGIIHRDVKPANILFRKDGTPLLSDFGIAKKLTVDHDLTATGIFLGSPNYMAPEQAEGGPIDGRADIYALGIIFYELLTGRKPYQAESVIDIIVQHKQAPLPELPAGLESYQPLLDLMIAKKRKDRFHDAESLLHYIRDMERRGAIKTEVEIVRAPDIDLSGGHTHGDTTRAGTAVQQLGARRIRSALLVSLIITGLGFGGVQYYARIVAAEIGRPSGKPPRAVAVQASPPAAPAAVAPASGRPAPVPASDDVHKALAWLAQKSLDDYRLTSPPKDSAYYYVSRLREVDPNSELARDGYRRIAERFALLAEREIAAGNDAQAQSYIAIGLELDPGNPVLLQLRTLAKPAPRGFMDTIVGLFSGGGPAK